MNRIEEQPSKESLVVLAALKEAAINVLEKKRKLGHYCLSCVKSAVFLLKQVYYFKTMNKPLKLSFRVIKPFRS